MELPLPKEKPFKIHLFHSWRKQKCQYIFIKGIIKLEKIELREDESRQITVSKNDHREREGEDEERIGYRALRGKVQSVNCPNTHSVRIHPSTFPHCSANSHRPHDVTAGAI